MKKKVRNLKIHSTTLKSISHKFNPNPTIISKMGKKSIFLDEDNPFLKLNPH
jgi:hypothetical protein